MLAAVWKLVNITGLNVTYLSLKPGRTAESPVVQ